jgi:hypothetical protein
LTRIEHSLVSERCEGFIESELILQQTASTSTATVTVIADTTSAITSTTARTTTNATTNTTTSAHTTECSVPFMRLHTVRSWGQRDQTRESHRAEDLGHSFMSGDVFVAILDTESFHRVL